MFFLHFLPFRRRPKRPVPPPPEPVIALARDASKLSHEASRCVLQYMEANLRCLFAFQCPAVYTRHVSVPLKMKSLGISQASIKVNDYEHAFQLLDRPPLNRNDPLFQSYVCYSIKLEHESWIKFQFPHRVSIHAAMQHHLRTFILGRNPVFVDLLKVDMEGLETIPAGLRFRAKGLDVPSYFVLQQITRFLEPESFPLKKLTVKVSEPRSDIFECPTLRNAGLLQIEANDYFTTEPWGQTLLDLPNKTICMGMEWDVSIRELAFLAKNWIEKSREIGTGFACALAMDDDDMERLAQEIKGLTGLKQGLRKEREWSVLTYPMGRGLFRGSDKELKIHLHVLQQHAKKRCVSMTIVNARRT